MEFTNVHDLERRMDNQEVSVAFFSITYGNCTVECVYTKELKKFLFVIVDANVGFTCSLYNSYKANAYINHQEALNTLARCRNHGSWSPTHFYEILNNNLPNVNFRQVTTQQYVNINTVAVSNFEDRIYFNHYRRGRISEKQANKTIELLGYEILNFCKKVGVIPVYFPEQTDRTMAIMNNFRLDYEQNNAIN